MVVDTVSSLEILHTLSNLALMIVIMCMIASFFSLTGALVNILCFGSLFLAASQVIFFIADSNINQIMFAMFWAAIALYYYQAR